MAEPQPPNTHEGADLEEETPALPKSAEDRKAAAAMSSVSAREDDGEATGRDVDQEALGKAMKNLSVGDLSGGAGGPKKEVDEGAKKAAEEREEKKKAAAARAAAIAAVKVDQADVGLLVEQLELSKIKATDLLKANEGDAVKAMEAFVTASA
ncbi:MAG: hypothetical protein M4579_004729 [Chaenotheca gracillima]|nr:MAG: hypothetical protein M4579_004729 [Chaenotheca gracillima]